MHGDNPDDARLREAWHAFCDQLKEAGELVFRDTAPASAIDRAKGVRLLARNIALGLQFELENNDPAFPELLHYFDPIRKQGATTPTRCMWARRSTVNTPTASAAIAARRAISP